MTLRNDYTGDVLEIPPPNELGESVIRFNGRVVEAVLYSDENGGSATTGDGRMFTIKEWPAYLVEQLEAGKWSSGPTKGEGL